MWILILSVGLAFAVVAALSYIRWRADRDEAERERAVMQEADERVRRHLENLSLKALQQRLDYERRRNDGHWN